MFTLIAVVFVFGILVMFHELGHFVTAKLTGMQVDEFAIGFGPKLISFVSGETRYSLRLIPLGGYNKIAGMEAAAGGDEEFNPRGFSSRPIWARLLVIINGSVMNFVLPLILLFLVFFAFGVPQFNNAPVVGQIDGQKAAYHAGMDVGDKITAVNGKAVKSWTGFVESMRANGENTAEITVERNGQSIVLKMRPQYDKEAGRPIVGVAPRVDYQSQSFAKSIGLAFATTGEMMALIVKGFMQIITGKSAAELAGPIGVIGMTAQVAKTGFASLLQFTAFLSINLGIINLFPLPALDGGYIILLILEAVRRKPLSSNTLRRIQMIGFALLMALFIFATIQDVTRISS